MWTCEQCQPHLTTICCHLIMPLTIAESTIKINKGGSANQNHWKKKTKIDQAFDYCWGCFDPQRKSHQERSITAHENHEHRQSRHFFSPFQAKNDVSPTVSPWFPYLHWILELLSDHPFHSSHSFLQVKGANQLLAPRCSCTLRWLAVHWLQTCIWKNLSFKSVFNCLVVSTNPNWKILYSQIGSISPRQGWK